MLNRRAAVSLILALSLTAAIAHPAWAKKGKAGKDGVRGTITTLEANDFIMSLGEKAATSDSKSSSGTKVDCDANTQFFRGSTAVSASELKQGMTVGVMGASVGPYEIRALRVNIISDSAPKAKTK